MPTRPPHPTRLVPRSPARPGRAGRAARGARRLRRNRDAAPPSPLDAHAPSGSGPLDASPDANDPGATAGPPPTTGRALAPEASPDANPDASPLADPGTSPDDPPGPVPAPGPIPAGRTACGPSDDAGRARALALVNAARATARRCGGAAFAAAPPLTWDARLERAAAVHSNDMAAHGFLSHVGSDGATVAGRVTATGLDWIGLGENVASGPSDARSALRFWLDGPNHCTNLMNPDYALLGTACTDAPGAPDGGADDGAGGAYWTLVLARAAEPDPSGTDEPADGVAPDAPQGTTAIGVRVQPDAP